MSECVHACDRSSVVASALPEQIASGVLTSIVHITLAITCPAPLCFSSFSPARTHARTRACTHARMHADLSPKAEGSMTASQRKHYIHCDKKRTRIELHRDDKASRTTPATGSCTNTTGGHGVTHVKIEEYACCALVSVTASNTNKPTSTKAR